jgi:acid phosphatase (class A)
MSLINKVEAIISNTSKSIDEVTFLPNKVNYDDGISILDIELTEILPPPPKNSSITTKKELEEISKHTRSRSESEIDLIRVVDRNPIELFSEYLMKEKLKFPFDKFAKYLNITEQYQYALKYYHNRARPEQLADYYNLDINVLITDTHHTPAYPSGHTMYAELAAYILTDAYPDRKKDFFNLSKYCGFARILQGVHYASDNEASRIAIAKLYPLIRLQYDPDRTKETTIDRSAS